MKISWWAIKWIEAQTVKQVLFSQGFTRWISEFYKNGDLGNGLGLQGEHILKIKLEFGEYEEEIIWDVSNSENCPLMFVQSVVSENNLPQSAV